MALLAWFKADAITGLSNGDPVATWPDSSIFGRHATQTIAAARPIYVTDIPGGGPIVRFGDNKGLNITNLEITRDSYTFYLLIRYTPDETPFAFAGALSAASGNGGWSVQPDRGTAGSREFTFLVSGNPVEPAAPSKCGWQCFACVVDKDNGRIRVYKNGNEIQNRAYTPTVTTDVAWKIGSPAGFTLGLVMDVAEIILYDDAHSASSVEFISTCLRNRWKLKPAQGV